MSSDPRAGAYREECAPGKHLVDSSLERCTECFWLDPEVVRCSIDNCIWPAEYEVEVLDKKDQSTVIATAPFCNRHAFYGGIGLVPHEKAEA